MTQLALASPDAVLPAETLSKQADVPRPYLSKIMRKLVAAKLAVAAKGPGGGFRLARPRGDIRFLDIIAAVGEEPAPDHCVFGWSRCDAKSPCPLHPTFSKLNDEMWSWATDHTLADVRPGPDIRRR